MNNGKSKINAWKPYEIEYLKNNYNKISKKEMSKTLFRSISSIEKKLHALGRVMYPSYSTDEENYIINNYGKIPTSIIAKVLNRSEKGIASKACSLGVAMGVRIVKKLRSKESIYIDNYIKENYASKLAKEIAKDLAINVSNVKIRAFKLGLRKYKSKQINNGTI